MRENYNQQLRNFYAAQGIDGKALRSALKHDRRRIRKLAAEHTPEVRVPSKYPIECLFSWALTQEGGDYWAARAGWM